MTEQDIRGIVKEAIHESWHDASGINSVIDKATNKLATLNQNDSTQNCQDNSSLMTPQTEHAYCSTCDNHQDYHCRNGYCVDGSRYHGPEIIKTDGEGLDLLTDSQLEQCFYVGSGCGAQEEHMNGYREIATESARKQLAADFAKHVADKTAFGMELSDLYHKNLAAAVKARTITMFGLVCSACGKECDTPCEFLDALEARIKDGE